MSQPVVIVIPTLDAARGEDTGRLAVAMAGVPTRLLVVNGPRRGFTATVNDGLRQTTTEDVCILNDDIAGFQHGWLRHLRAGLYTGARYGLAGPSGKSATPPASGGRPGLDGIEIVRQLAFWCVLIRRDVLREVGLLDERFIHYCSDNDYCRRAAAKNWRCVWVRGVYLEHHHHGSGLVTEWKEHDMAQLTKANRRRG